MKKLLLHIFLMLGFITNAQSPFTCFRMHLQTDNFSACQKILDSCSFSKYHEDSVLYFKAMLTLKKGNIKGAKIHAANLQKNYPMFTEVHYLNGLILYTADDYGKSIEEFTTILNQNPKQMKARYNRALAYGMLEDYKSATTDLSTCIEQDSTYAVAYYSRAYWYEFAGKPNEAIKDYETSIRLDPKNYDAYMGLAYIYNNQKDMTKACEVLNKAIVAGSVAAAELKENYCNKK
jgi:tetratricopeptide (TPR) repeat protein